MYLLDFGNGDDITCYRGISFDVFFTLQLE